MNKAAHDNISLHPYCWNLNRDANDIPVMRASLRERLSFQAKLKLTPTNFGFLAACLVLAVLGATPAYELARALF